MFLFQYICLREVEKLCDVLHKLPVKMPRELYVDFFSLLFGRIWVGWFGGG